MGGIAIGQKRRQTRLVASPPKPRFVFYRCLFADAHPQEQEIRLQYSGDARPGHIIIARSHDKYMLGLLLFLLFESSKKTGRRGPPQHFHTLQAFSSVRITSPDLDSPISTSRYQLVVRNVVFDPQNHLLVNFRRSSRSWPERLPLDEESSI